MKNTERLNGYPLCTIYEDGVALESTLTLTPEQIRAQRWTGISRNSDGRVVVAYISESDVHAGFFDCVVLGASRSETKRPIAAEGVGAMMDVLLTGHGVTAKDMKWTPTADRVATASHSSMRPVGGIVYFLRAGDFIKIGKTTGSPDNRVSQLKTGCPFPIEVMATVRGGYDEERALHKRFASIRAHGEWFHASRELLAYVRSIGGDA